MAEVQCPECGVVSDVAFLLEENDVIDLVTCAACDMDFAIEPHFTVTAQVYRLTLVADAEA
jgi:transcription elongation factor Elf1